MGIGKWILGGLGWSMYGPIGGILGFLIGGSVERLTSRISSGGSNDGNSQRTYQTPPGNAYRSSGSGPRTSSRYRNTGSQEDLSAALLVLIAAVMKADNVVKKSELDLVKRFLVSNYDEETAKTMLLKLRELQRDDIPLGDVCRQIKENTDYTTRYHILDFLFSISDADGDVTLPEISVLKTISNRLGINARDYLSIMARHVNDGSRSFGGFGSGFNSGAGERSRRSEASSSYYGKDPYRVLGLDSSASDDEVKKAYRRLAMKYHPHKVESMGEEVKRNAEAQFREINEAYETIKASRGMK